MEDAKIGLYVWDYVLISLMLIISAAIGVYFRITGSKRDTTADYLLAGKDMSILPVAFSIMASFFSAQAIIGTPTEVYYFGAHLFFIFISYFIGMAISSYITLPVYFKMGVSTVYEYVYKRFGKHTRTLTSGAFIFQMILYMSIVLYAPSLSLSAVTNLSMWVSIIAVGIVCTFYCTIGGMKAVLWTDVFQSFLMFFGVATILTKGLLDVGFYNMLKLAKEGGRLSVPSFEFSAFKRFTVWNILVQGVFSAFVHFSANQVQVQRLLTLKNIRRSRWALYSSMPISFALYVLVILTGLVVYAYFVNCDPLSSPNHPISKGDQLLPYLMVKSLSNYPGLSGLCICGIFSASLSTVSSCVNSLSAVTMQDLIRPYLLSRGFSERKLSVIAQLTNFVYGLLCIALTFMFASAGSLVQLSWTVFGCLGGPVLGVFLLGMFTTRANEKGVNIAFLIGVVSTACIGINVVAHSSAEDSLPVSIEGCPNINSSVSVKFLNGTQYNDIENNQTILLHGYKNQSNLNVESNDSEYVFPLYRISFMWIIAIGFFLTYITGYITSITLNVINGETKEVAPELISPLMKCFYSLSKTNTDMNIKELKEMNSDS